jgi:SAM-dependent methyltransferase
MSVFNHYARYYDLLYRDKDYAGEARFVHDQFAQHGLAAGRLLELGCGTGRHAVEFAKLGWSVDGVDLSQAMVAQAQERARQQQPEITSRIQFQQGDLRSADTGQTYDAIISLFHVMSYQTSNADLAAAVATAAAHLRTGGLFLFDFWYGPAVLRAPLPCESSGSLTTPSKLRGWPSPRSARRRIPSS